MFPAGFYVGTGNASVKAWEILRNVMTEARMTDRSESVTSVNGLCERLARIRSFCYTLANHFISIVLVAWWLE